MIYEKPVAEITNFEVEAVMSDGEVTDGPSGLEPGTGDSPFG